VRRTTVSINPSTAAADFYTRIENAWNAADGAAFGAAFDPDASFVDIRGDAHDGAAAIGGGHQGIFDTVYRDSRVTYGVDTARALDETVVVARAHSTLHVPGGPLAGTHQAISTAVLLRTGDAWTAVAFHNTLIGK
jgi:uncharacterized protein (TIGR02246 family)